MTDSSTSNIEATFREAEWTGLRLAIKGRFAVIFQVAVWIVLTRTATVVAGYLSGLAILGLLGLAHYTLIASRWDRPWVKSVFITVDIAIISWAVAAQPVMPSDVLPPVLIFRFNIFPFYFLIMTVAAFSFSPGLVLWSGIAGCIGWLSVVRRGILTPYWGLSASKIDPPGFVLLNTPCCLDRRGGGDAGCGDDCADPSGSSGEGCSDQEDGPGFEGFEEHGAQGCSG